MKNVRAMILVVLCLGLLLPTGLATSAVAEEPAGPSIFIDSFRPAIPGPTADLTITGRVANSGPTAIALPAVQLRFSPTPLTARPEISQVLTGTSQRTGLPIPTSLTSLGEVLQPGQQLSFRLQVPVTALNLGESGAVFALFVEALSGSSSLTATGTVFPWFPETANFKRSRLALLWPVTQYPAIAAQRLVVGEGVLDDYQPDGRLSRLVSVGSQHDVSWLIDSSTAQSARKLSSGYVTESPSGPQPGDATDAAGRMSRQLSAVLENQPNVAVPQFALADADALIDNGLDSNLVRAISLPRVIVGGLAPEADPTAIFDAPGSVTRPKAMAAVADSGLRIALASDDVFPPSPLLPFTPSGVTRISAGDTSLDVILTDCQLDSYLESSLASQSIRSTAMQGFLSEMAMVTLERPLSPRTIAAMPPPLWDPPSGWTESLLRRLARAPWVKLVGWDAVLQAEAVPRKAMWEASQPTKGQLPKNYMRRVKQLQRDLDGLLGIITDPDGFGESFQLAIQRASSSLWRGQPRQRDQLVSAIESQLAAARESVRVLTTQGTITLAGDSGNLPLTISNELDRAVTVKVDLATESTISVDYLSPEPVTIEPKGKASLEIPVRVLGTQPVQVQVVLSDKSGNVFSDAATLELRSTAATQIAGVIVGVGGGALILLVVLNLWRRHRKREASHHES